MRIFGTQVLTTNPAGAPEPYTTTLNSCREVKEQETAVNREMNSYRGSQGARNSREQGDEQLKRQSRSNATSCKEINKCRGSQGVRN